MSANQTDRNLFLGMIALQADYINRDQLIDGLSVWMSNKERSVDDIFFEKGYISQEQLSLLQQFAGARQEDMKGDLVKSITSLPKVKLLQEGLDGLSDVELKESINRCIDQYLTEPSVTERDSETLRFLRLRPHARGGLGVVWVANDKELNREVAVKEIKQENADVPELRTQFLLEGEIAGGLEHPNIVPVYGMGKYSDGRPYYAMKFVRGMSFKEAIDQFHFNRHGNSFSPQQSSVELRKLLARFIDVCHAISYAHSRCVLHRDLKPDNIMLGKFGETVVVDWGLAEAYASGLPRNEARHSADDSLADEKPLRPSSGTFKSEPGKPIGTYQFMSPEQARGEIDLLNYATDIYSLGATLYQLLTGQVYVSSTSVVDTLQKIQTGDFLKPREVRPDIPKPLEAICLKAMALEQKARYASARALAEDIECWLADDPIEALKDTRVEWFRRWLRKNRSWAQVAAASLIAITFISVIAVYAVDKSRRSERVAREITEAAAAFDLNLRDADRFDQPFFDSMNNYLTQLSELNAPGLDVKTNSLRQLTEQHLKTILDRPRFDEAASAEFDKVVNAYSEVYGQKVKPELDHWTQLRQDRSTKWITKVDIDHFDESTISELSELSEPVRIDATQAIFRQPKLSDKDEMEFVRLDATDTEWGIGFGANWTLSSVLGITVNYFEPESTIGNDKPSTDSKGRKYQLGTSYQFLISSPSLDVGTFSKRTLAKAEAIESLFRSEPTAEVQMSIVGNGKRLRSKTIHLPRGPVKLTCKRENGSFSFYVTGDSSYSYSMDCNDPFISSLSSAKVGVLWPKDVRIKTVLVRHKQASSKPSALEKADRLYAANDYLGAFSLYEKLPATFETRYKKAIVLEALGQENAYLNNIDEIANDTTATPDDVRWRVLALIRKLSVYAEKRDWKKVQEGLNVIRNSELPADSLALIPQSERDLVLDQLGKVGLRFRLVFQTSDDVRSIEMRNELLDTFSEDDSIRRNTIWRLADAYRVANRYDEAKQLLEDLVRNRWRFNFETKEFVSPLSPRDHRILISDLAWLLTAEGNSPTDALQLIQTWLHQDVETASRYSPLLIEQARIQLILFKNALESGNQQAAQRWLKDASQSLEQFAKSESKVSDLTYMEYGQNHLLRAMVAEESNRESIKTSLAGNDPTKNVMDMRKAALRRTWKGGPLQTNIDSKMDGAEGVMATMELAIDGAAVSYVQEISSDEVNRAIDCYIPGSGLSSTLVRSLKNSLIKGKDGGYGPITTEQLLKRLFTELYDSEEGNKLRERMILRTCSLFEFQHDPLYHILYRAIVLGGFEKDGFPVEAQKSIWEELKRLVNLYDTANKLAEADNNSGIGPERAFQDSDLGKILKLFTGNYENQTWVEVKQILDRKLAGSAAYVFGGVYRQRNELNLAKKFFQEAIENRETIPEIVEASRQELKIIDLQQ